MTDQQSLAVRESPRYEKLTHTDEVRQGDILVDYPVIIATNSLVDLIINSPPDQELNIPAEIVRLNVIVMSQSCDIEHAPDRNYPITICPIKSFPDAVKSLGEDPGSFWKELRKNGRENYYLLDECKISGYSFDYQVVDFSRTYSTPLSDIKKFCELKDRVGMVSPYIEHLSQQFAKQFMRVGLSGTRPELYPYALENIEGIGEKTALKLREAGISWTYELAKSTPAKIGAIYGYDTSQTLPNRFSSWIEKAQQIGGEQYG